MKIYKIFKKYLKKNILDNPAYELPQSPLSGKLQKKIEKVKKRLRNPPMLGYPLPF